MELTCRSKSFTTRYHKSASSRGKNSKAFVKGQRAFYRSNRGIEKVTVVGVHHDAKLVPYYTIQLRDGKEKQTDGKHLNHVKEDMVKKEGGGSSSSENNGKGKSRSESDRGSGSGGEVEGEGGGSKSTGSDNDTDPMTESSNESNVKNEVADSGKLSRRESSGGDSSLYENDKFTEGQDAYYRSPDGAIAKVRIRSLHHDPYNGYTISLPDGSQLADVKQSHLATLMELSSKELSQLMKERNKRPPSSTGGSKSHNQRFVRRSSSSTHEDSTTTDKGNASEAKEPLATSTSDLSDSLDDLGNKKKFESTTPANPSSDSTESKEEKAKPHVPTVRMVEAKTEDGTSKTVPLYEAGMTLNYKNAAGVQECTIVCVHLDDLLEPYYDIRLADGHEKQTDNAHLMLKSDAVGEDGEGDRKDTQDAEVVGGSSGEEAKCPVSPKEQRQQHSPPGEEAIPSSTSKEEPEGAAVNETPDNINRSNTPKQPKEDPVTSASVNNSTGFSIGNEVIYTSSEGEQIRAVVLKLQHDKKNRPYYVVRLHPMGKEKQVYGHRLQLCSPENNNSDEPQSRRSRSRLRRRSSSKTNESDDTAGDGNAGGGSNRRSDPAPRSESIDSRRSSLSNSSRRAADRKARRERDGTDPTPRSESIDSRRSSLSNSSRRAADRKARRERDESRTRERHTADPIGTTSRSRSMSAVRQGRTLLGKSSSGGCTESRGSRERSRSRARGDGKERASSRAPGEARDRSRSRAPGEGRERSCSRARSEGSSSSSRPTPSQPLSNTKKLNSSSENAGAFSKVLSSAKGKAVAESDSPSSKAAGKSIAKLKSFRSSFSAMKFRRAPDLTG